MHEETLQAGAPGREEAGTLPLASGPHPAAAPQAELRHDSDGVEETAPITGKRYVRGSSSRSAPRIVPDPYEQLRKDIYHGEEEEEQVDAPPGFLQVCWPAVAGIILAVLAPQLHAYVTDRWGDLGERLLFPYMLLAGRPELGLSDELRQNLPDILQWLAFPVLGLYVSFSMRKRVKFSLAVAQVIFVNLIAAFVLWLLSKPGASHGM